MTFEIRKSSIFARHLNSLSKRFHLSKPEALLVLDEIEEATKLLAEYGTLPDEYGYNLHTLRDEPWLGYMEFHIADDILVLYFNRLDKQVIRLVGIYNHEMLRMGKID